MTGSSSNLLNETEFSLFKQGDKTIFRKVYDTYVGLTQYVAVRCGLTITDSHDVVQDAFIQLFHHTANIQSAQGIKSWLVTTTRNLALDNLRKQQTIHKFAFTARQNDDEPVTAQHLRELELILLGKLIEQVSIETGDDTLKLFYSEGLSAKQIAVQNNEPISTVTNRLSRLRKRFREHFKSHIEQLRNTVS